MSRTDADVEAFINDLDTDEAGALIELVAKLDSVATVDGTPVYTGEEITLIGRFQQFVVDHEVDDEDDDDDEDFDDDVEEEDVNGENSEDIPGTGETDEPTAVDVPVDTPAAPAWTPSLSDEALAEDRKQNPGYGFAQ